MSNRLDHDLIVQMRLDHPTWTSRQIAEAVGAKSPDVIQRILRKRVGRQFENRPYTEEEEKRALAMLEEGVPYTEVAATLNRNRHRLAKKFPGYALSHSEIAQINHMKRQFERFLESRGLADVGQAAR